MVSAVYILPLPPGLTLHDEIEGAKRELPMRWKEVEFTGGLSVVDGQLLRVVDPTLPAYVGSPTPEMDALWDKLIMRKSTSFGSTEKGNRAD